MGEPVIRQAARIIVIDDSQRVLLIRIPSSPKRPDTPLWFTPGGGIEPGEEAHEAARRELWEETGFQCPEIGPEIWRRSFPFTSAAGDAMIQFERYFVARCDAFEPVTDNFMEGEASFITSFRWWTVEEIFASNHHFSPRALGALLEPIVRGDYPESPIDCGR